MNAYWVRATIAALLSVGLTSSAAAEELASCWLEGNAVKCKRSWASPGRCEQKPSDPATEPVDLLITFTAYGKTVEADVECCRCSYNTAPFRCPDPACGVRNITSIPTWPVTLQLRATRDGKTYTSEVRTLASAADGPTAAAPLRLSR